jgi:hypothetical protein
MPKETTYWACEVCGSAFELKTEAEMCESAHYKLDSMNIIEVKFSEEHSLFPVELLIQSEGSGAIYSLKRTGSIEDFVGEDIEW